MNNNFVKTANQLGIFFVILFIICFAWYYLKGQTELHLQLLRLTFFGYSGMNVVSFVLAAIQAYVAGYVLVGLWQLAAMVSGKK